MDFLEDSHEISSSYLDSSEVGDLDIGCDFQNLQPCQFEPHKQNQANHFQCDRRPDKVVEKANSSLYKIVLESLGGANVGNVMQRLEKLTVFAKDLVALDELKV